MPWPNFQSPTTTTRRSLDTVQKSALPPNYVHSLDSSHMLMTAKRCADLGMTFAAVHDSYWTHARDVATMNEVLREEFVRLHEQTTLAGLYEQLKERYYDMCKNLLNARSEAGDAEAAGHPLLKFKYDPRLDRERKAEFERLYHRTDQEVRDEVQRLEQAKALEAKLKLQKKMAKPGGRASGLAALRASLSAQASRQ